MKIQKLISQQQWDNDGRTIDDGKKQMSLNAIRQKIKRAHTHDLYVKGHFDIWWLEYQTFIDGLVNGNNKNDEFRKKSKLLVRIQKSFEVSLMSWMASGKTFRFFNWCVTLCQKPFIDAIFPCVQKHLRLALNFGKNCACA